MPIWAAVVLARMLFAFGVFIGYAITGLEDLRAMEQELDDIERRRKQEEWT